jgi:hypothetical protein
MRTGKMGRGSGDKTGDFRAAFEGGLSFLPLFFLAMEAPNSNVLQLKSTSEAVDGQGESE